ncbi:DUF4396 domain-containing protein [Blastococcus saxobsidens]|uniref:DUF4396 domain-containing protein n=1 Tax=Blastococcus saxobsidens TaxID=138336 RepID=A0A6L9W6Q5_9ACTN|nr:DUF4396 domain-containing protein [Blastococcus saxobsidens]NEK87074.1 DUF4396 domain-containing protein [Blastococcus saxobsidens]
MAAEGRGSHGHAQHHLDGGPPRVRRAARLGRPVTWASAAQATLHCLTGCAIGEILGMVIGTSLGLHDLATVALGVALAADTLSITVMETVDNAAMLAIPGAMEAGISSPVFWLLLAGALALAFVVTLPINRRLMSRGKGHAVVHAHAHS